MLNMSHLSLILKSTKKSYSFPLKDTSLVSLESNSLDILPIRKWEGKLKFLISVKLNLILFQ